MTIRLVCPVCRKPIASADGCAKFEGAIVHATCYFDAKAKLDAAARAQKEVPSTATREAWMAA